MCADWNGVVGFSSPGWRKLQKYLNNHKVYKSIFCGNAKEQILNQYVQNEW